MRPAGQPPASRTGRHSSDVGRRGHRFLRSRRAYPQPSTGTRGAGCAGCGTDRGGISAPQDWHEMSAPNAHRARTDLIGGAKPREVISDADGRALEMTGTGRTAGAAEFALSPGFTAHSRESGMRKACARLPATILQRGTSLKRKTQTAVKFVCMTKNSCAKARRNSPRAFPRLLTKREMHKPRGLKSAG